MEDAVGLALVVALPERAGLPQAEEIAGRIREALEEENPEVVIDASRVEGTDLSLLQILIAAKSAADERGKRLTVTGIPAALAGIAELAGLGNILAAFADEEGGTEQ